MRGRPRKPSHLKLLDGNPGHKPFTFGPTFEKGFGSCPKYISKEGKKLWKTLTKELDSQGMSAKVYGALLEGLCYWYGEFRRLVIEVAEEDTFKSATSGYEGPRPQVKMSQVAFQNYKSACVEFGFSPASSSRVSAPKTKKQSLKDSIMGSKRAV